MWDKMETPAVVYDLDTSGGLMEQIQTLLAPPKSEDGEKRSRRPEKDSRRSGRATNHDTCDSCREGGDLLCCDYCPAAFHLQCCNPPLSEEMLPPGDWMCHRCVMRGKKRDLKKDQINGLLERPLSKRPSSPATELELGVVRLDGAAGVGTGARAAVAQVRLLERRAGSRPGTPTSNASSDTATPSEQNEEADEDLLDAEDEAPGSEPEGATPRLRRPFELLIAAAMERNPTQFQLPSDLTCTTALPGTSKRRRKEETTGKNVKKPQHELDHNGLVPLPVKVCFSCGRSCRLAPLIQCDYCPLLFHMDCLDPPLTALPTGRWMCPNHIEHVVLNQKSMTLSNRCQLFDQFQDRLSQHAIKVDFLQRVHRQNPPNRRGAHQHGRKKLKVPDAVKAQYRVPPALMAPAGIRSGELICNGIPEAPSQRPTSPQHLTTETEQQEWLRSVVALQCSIIRHLSAKQTAKQTSSTFWDSERTEEADVKPCMTTEDHNTLSPTASPSPAPCPDPRAAPVSPQGAPVLKEVQGRCSSCVEVPCPNCGTANGPLGPPAEANGILDCRQSELQHRLGGTPPVPAHTGVAAVKTEDATLTPCAQTGASPFPADAGLLAQSFRAPLGTAGGQAAALTSRCVSSPAAGTRAVTPPRATKDTAMARMASPTPPSEIEMSKLDEKFIKLLAWQRIQQLFPPKVASPPISCVGIPAPNTSPPRPQAPHTEANRSEVQARAVFYPLTGKAGAVNMCYRTLYIGTGADMDVCLKNYGHCNYVSGKHACIFYDENTKHYELLNYSEHGTTVDNVLYSCDFSEKSSPGPSSSLVSKVQNIIRHCKKRKQEEGEDGPAAAAAAVMSCQSRGGPRTICGCKASSSSLIGGSGAGWEGTALLHHGSYIKMGCLQFVFSVTEFALRQPKEHALKLHQASVLRSNSVP